MSYEMKWMLYRYFHCMYCNRFVQRCVCFVVLAIALTACVSCRSHFQYVSGTELGITYRHDLLSVSINKRLFTTKGHAGSKVVVSAVCSIDGNRVISWNLGDGSEIQYGNQIEHFYVYANTYTIQVHCENNQKTVAQKEIVVQVEYQPQSLDRQNPHRNKQCSWQKTLKNGELKYRCSAQ